MRILLLEAMSTRNVVIGVVLLFALCVLLFLVGVQIDEASVRPTDNGYHGRTQPVHHSLAVQLENEQLKARLLGIEKENAELRARLRHVASGLSTRGTAAVVPELDLARAASQASAPAASTATAAASAAASRAAPAATRAAPAATPVEDVYDSSTEFTEARAKAVAASAGGKIILTFVNKIRLDFATSWVAHVRRLRLRNWLVGATDRPALQELLRTRVPCFDMSTNLPEGEWPWGSPSFKALGPHKIELIYQAIKWDLNPNPNPNPNPSPNPNR